MSVENDPRVDKQIRALPRGDSARIIRVIDLFQDYGFSLPEKYLKKITRNLWELRTGRWRLLFGMVKQKAAIVNIFLKKSQKTPKQQMKIALNRLKEYL